MDAAIDLSKVIQAHNAIRDARTVRRHAWEAADAELEREQNMLRAVLLDYLNQTGAKSIATDEGTVYRSEKIRPSAADWSEIWRWMKEHDAMDLLEARLKTTFVKKYMDDHDGALPPGVNIHREFEVTVRRPNNTSAS